MSEYAYAKMLESKGYNVKIDKTTYETYKTHNYELDKFNILSNIKIWFSECAQHLYMDDFITLESWWNWCSRKEMVKVPIIC